MSNPFIGIAYVGLQRHCTAPYHWVSQRLGYVPTSSPLKLLVEQNNTAVTGMIGPWLR